MRIPRGTHSIVAGVVLSTLGCSTNPDDPSVGDSDAGYDSPSQPEGDSSIDREPEGDSSIDVAAEPIIPGVGPWDGGQGPPRNPTERMPPPPWMPPFDIGSSGWKSSSTPFCTPNRGQIVGYDMWRDGRGLYVLAAASCNDMAGRPCGEAGLVLQFNDGTGWRTLYDTGAIRLSGRLTGFPEGPLVLYGTEGCGIAYFENGQRTCQAPNFYPEHLITVDSTLAYAVEGNKVLKSTGIWEVIATLPDPVRAVWASRDAVVAVGARQAVYLQRGSGDFSLMPNVPAGEYTAVWATGPDDVWVGNSASQIVHYDGSTWSPVDTGLSKTTNPDFIRGLWGQDGQIFFHTRYEFGRVLGGSSELLLSRYLRDAGAGARIEIFSMWGSSPNEVFLSISDFNYLDYECGGLFAVWFDGSKFHQF
jgi:hypothetical protein